MEDEGVCEENAPSIREAVLRSSKDVLIFAHSKGGLDTLEMLLSDDGSALAKVKGFVPIQSPFWGSPVADWVLGQQTLSDVSFKLLRDLGGDEASLRSLATGIRTNYYGAHWKEIQALWSHISTIAFASWKQNEPWKWDSLLEWIRNACEDNGHLNDGLVPVDHALYPFADYIKVPEVDHAVSVMHCVFIDFDRVRFIKTLLLMIHTKIESH